MSQPAWHDRRLVRRTQVIDIARAVPIGISFPLESSILLVIAIHQFSAGSIVKGVIAAGPGLGLLGAPILTAWARRSHRRAMTLAGLVTAVGAACFAIAATGSELAFVLGSVGAVATLPLTFPLVTEMYSLNFPPLGRGKRVGWGLALKVAVAAGVAALMGDLLEHRPDRWTLVLLSGALALLALAVLNAAMPSPSLAGVEGIPNRPWPHFALIAEDRRLRLTLTSWMLMGFGNLMLLPLRTEYLSNSSYGIGADAAKVSILTVTVPAVVRLLTLPLFGVVFDHMSFFVSRMTVNLLFALYAVAFFLGTSDVGLYAGSVLFGVATAGGDLMWTLWVTKFAPDGRVADYMGLHTFFTGIRAVTAPVVAFAVITQFPISSVAFAGAALMLTAALVLLPEARVERASRLAAAA